MSTTLRVHVLGIPHTSTNALFSGCAFTQKVRKLVTLLAEDNPASSARYEVVHYGCERSEIHPNAEHVTVTPWGLLESTYGKEWWTRRVPLDWNDAPNQVFRVNATRELKKRVEPNDIVLASWGKGHEAITREVPQAIVVEPGIGYPVSGAFAPYKVFESYAYMNYHYGRAGVQNPSWYDAVIPNWFDLSEFDFSADKDDYLLFIGRIQEDKGLRVYVQLAEQLGFKLVVGGHGRLADLGIKPPRNVEEVGFCDVEKRRRLMSRARGYLLFSTYVEPFGGAAVEAMLSGTPVVTSDVGAFPETVLHGVTGYRCRTFDQLVWAVRNLDCIDPQACRAWAEANYSTSRIRLMFDEYLGMLHQRHTDDRGWYARDHERGDVSWLEKTVPEKPRSALHSFLSEKDEEPEHSPFTAVTALYDIGRESIDGRRFRDYLTWFERTLALRVPMIVYVHPDLVRFVEIARGDRPTRIVARPEPPLFDRLERFDRASAALRSLEHRLSSGSWRLEALSPRYLATVWSKMVWMREAIRFSADPALGGSMDRRIDGLLWIDAGASRFFGDLDLSAPWPHPSWRDALNAGRIVIEGHPGMRDALAGRRAIDAAIVGTSECLLAGTCWGGSRAAMARLSERMLDLLEGMLTEERVDNEQVGLALLWSREPDLFDVRLRDATVPADVAGWLEIVRKLGCPTSPKPFKTDEEIHRFLRAHEEACGRYHEAALQQCLDAIEHVVSGKVVGDIVEIGVYKGVMVMAMCAKLIQLGATDRIVHLYDTFEGMTPPTKDDVLVSSGAAPDLQDPNVLVCSPLEQVKKNLSLVGYPAEQLRFHVGDICRTEPADVPDKIAFLRLDTDWYESTRFELETFAPHVALDGIIAQDDYGWWAGATKAVDEHLERQVLRKPNRLVPHGIWWVV